MKKYVVIVTFISRKKVFMLEFDEYDKALFDYNFYNNSGSTTILLEKDDSSYNILSS